MTKIFDGREYAGRKMEVVRRRAQELRARGITPTLVSLFLPTDAGSALYTKIKKQKAQEVGIEFQAMEMDGDADGLVKRIVQLNKQKDVHGILVQKPSGEKDFTREAWSKIVSAIDPAKDVDCLTPENLGLLMLGTPKFVPATVVAVLEVLAAGNVAVDGKYIVVLGASQILGKPLAAILTEQDATVTVVHSATRNLQKHTREADILISATGQEGIVGAGKIKEGAVVIDVGAPKGDVSRKVAKKASFLSPVPGGVGPVTIACLLENLIEACYTTLSSHTRVVDP